MLEIFIERIIVDPDPNNEHKDNNALKIILKVTRNKFSCIINDVFTISEHGKWSILLVLCFSRDGVTGCGVFCAVYNAIQQLQQDEEVNMFTIVRQLQSRRPEMISDLVNITTTVFCLDAYLKDNERDETKFRNIKVDFSM